MLIVSKYSRFTGYTRKVFQYRSLYVLSRRILEQYKIAHSRRHRKHTDARYDASPLTTLAQFTSHGRSTQLREPTRIWLVVPQPITESSHATGRDLKLWNVRDGPGAGLEREVVTEVLRD